MDERQTLHAMGLDDAYQVYRVLADGPYGRTELVGLEGAGPFVRKTMPLKLARRRLWSTLAECDSSRLPRIEATYELPDGFVVVYDYVEGVTLAQYIGTHGRLDVRRAVTAAIQLCEAVGELHRHGIVHRDITPANIILADDGIHLIDFGIAREYAAGQVKDGCTTALGTWGYAAPEQYGFSDTDARTDVYAIGRVLGFMLTGVEPTDGAYASALADAAVVPAGLDSIVEKASAFEPSARPQTVDELRAYLEDGGLDGAVAGASAGGAVDGADVGGKTRTGATGPVNPGTGGTGGDGDGRNTIPASDGVRRRKRSRISSRTRIWLASAVAVVLLTFIGAAGYVVMHGSSIGDAGRSGGGSTASQSSPGLQPGTQGEDNGADAGNGSGDDSAADNALTLVESGWSAESGYVDYAIALRNTDRTRSIVFPQVSITGRKSDGSVLFADTMTSSIIYPGQTIYISGICGDGIAPATVVFDTIAPKSENLMDTDGSESFDTTGVNRTRLDDGGVVFSGEVVAKRDDDNGDGVYGDEVCVTLVLRDRTGAIVFGRDTYVEKPTLGQSQAFSITVYGLPDYADYALYARTA